ncbi:MAG TPA: hypothetical protein VD886_18805 [Herpetosiphonaceae bacterium]|nr:hypothetical protein [Herpetosiphonaceae bacterium]
MNSTVFMIYRGLLIGLMAGSIWGSAAYAKAFWSVRRLIYLLLSLSWLTWPGTFTVIYLLRGDLLTNVAPLLPFIGLMLGWALSHRPSAEFREFRSPRDIMFFKDPLAAAPQREGLFVPEAPPQRPSPWAILLMTIGFLAACTLLNLLR